MIITCYTVSIVIKMVGVVSFKMSASEPKWVSLVFYVAITLTWTMMYFFVFEMRAVQIKIKTEDPRESIRRVMFNQRIKVVTMAILVISLSLNIGLISL